MEFQFKLFEIARLNRAKKILEDLRKNHAKKRNFQRVLENIISIVENYQKMVDVFGLEHEDFELERISCFVEIIIQSVISAGFYCNVGVEKLREIYGDEDLELISEKCKNALLTFWQRGIMLKPRLKNALDNGWNRETFIVLLKL